nr:DUF1876 domain-containing protein [Streptomyces zinciresistens]
MEDKQWTVRIRITEDGGDTRAEAVLAAGDAPAVTGRGAAHRNPLDRPVAEIGDELAASRALEDLATRLRAVAADGIAGSAGPLDDGAWERP